jgi:RES domain-containing protein
MEVFKICREEYASQLKASGVAIRWNFRGQYVIYTASSISLATLELVVRRNSITPLNNYKVMVISIADDDSLITQVHLNELTENWRTLAAYSSLQEIGSKWYTTQRTLILKVPSAVIPYEYNYVINTEHPDYNRKVKFVKDEDYFWDKRLL